MNFSEKPVVACFFLRDSYGVLAMKRWWEGIQYLGLPGTQIPDTEEIEACARRVLCPGKKGVSDIAIVRSLGRYLHMGGSEDYLWDGRPAALNIFAFPDADIIAPVTSEGTSLTMDEIMNGSNPNLDITFTVLKEVIKKENRRKAS